MNTSKVALVVNTTLGKIASIVGYVLGSMSLIAIIYAFQDQNTEGSDLLADMIIFSLFLALSVFLIVKGIQIKRRIKRYKRYVFLISTQQMTALENLAASTSQSIDFVRNDLEKMIHKKFFANAAIDMAANEIIIGGGTTHAPASTSAFQQAKSAAQTELEVFTCSKCGASGTKAKGMPGSCDYCGSVVK
jgi:hypothetical protein